MNDETGAKRRDAAASRAIKIAADSGSVLLHFPVKTGAAARTVTVRAAGKIVRQFSIELADEDDVSNHNSTVWWAPFDASPWRGQTLTIEAILPEQSRALEMISQDTQLRDNECLYSEKLRNQLHFSPCRGWLNDPNGMVFSQGEYHLYFQHNPYGWNWGNMHWGHAVSRDLVQWQELPTALYPHGVDDWVFSGSAVVDEENTSGWQRGENALIVAAYTSTARGECMVYSHDKGRTFTEYEGNPVVKHRGRDPRLLWHAARGQWVMAIYSEDATQSESHSESHSESQSENDKRHCIDFYTSHDLKNWTYQSRIEGFYECPDIFELNYHGEKKWVLTAADSQYLIGSFDGKTFTPETEKLSGHRGRGFYAAQTFSHEPKNRVVQMGWLQVATPGMPFNQAMSLPMELSLQATPDGPRLARAPVEELKQLRDKTHCLGALFLAPNAPNPLAEICGELLELRAKFAPPAQGKIVFTLRGVPIIYDAEKQEISIDGHSAALPLRDRKTDIVIYIDRTIIEVFAGDGLVYIPLPVTADQENSSLQISVTDAVQFDELTVYELHSIWEKNTE